LEEEDLAGHYKKPASKGEAGGQVRIPMMPIRRSDPMPISAERSDARLSQSETLIDIRQEFCGSGR
jgi:hypothetical protein